MMPVLIIILANKLSLLLSVYHRGCVRARANRKAQTGVNVELWACGGAAELQSPRPALRGLGLMQAGGAGR